MRKNQIHLPFDQDGEILLSDGDLRAVVAEEDCGFVIERGLRRIDVLRDIGAVLILLVSEYAP